MNVALAMSIWNDIAVTYWHQVYHQSEESYQDRRLSCVTERFAHEKRYLNGRKAPYPATCDSVELLRHELLAHLPEWLSRKAGVLGCTSSPTILFRCWKEIFPNEDATRFGGWAWCTPSEVAHEHVPVCHMARGLDGEGPGQYPVESLHHLLLNLLLSLLVDLLISVEEEVLEVQVDVRLILVGHYSKWKSWWMKDWHGFSLSYSSNCMKHLLLNLSCIGLGRCCCMDWARLLSSVFCIPKSLIELLCVSFSVVYQFLSQAWITSSLSLMTPSNFWNRACC